MSEQLRDIRKQPFVWVGVDALAALETLDGTSRTMATGIYMAILAVANEKREQEFRSFRAHLAKRAGVSPATFDRYAEKLIDLGLLAKKPTKQDGKNGANIWTILSFSEKTSQGGLLTSDEGVSSPVSRVPQKGDANGGGGLLTGEEVIQQGTTEVINNSKVGSSTDVSFPRGTTNASYPREVFTDKKRSSNLSEKFPTSSSSFFFSETGEKLSAPDGVPENFWEGMRKRPEDAVVEIFFYWVQLTAPRNRKLSPSRARVISKALVERNVTECKHALRGLVVWQRQRGGGLELSRVFQSRPGGSPLGEQIDWYIEQGKKFSLIAGKKKVLSADPALISRKLTEVQRGHGAAPDSISAKNAEGAKRWLEERGVEIMYLEDGYPVLKEAV